MAEQNVKQMLPEVKQYLDAMEAAENAQKEADRKLYAEYNASATHTLEEQVAFGETRDAVFAARLDAGRAAWEALKTSSDPLVKYIAENWHTYRSEAVTLMAILPATVEEMDELAERHEWCSTYVEFKNAAREAGVLPGTKPVSAAHKAVLDLVDREACCFLGASARGRVSAALDALVAEAVTGTPEEAQAA